LATLVLSIIAVSLVVSCFVTRHCAFQIDDGFSVLVVVGEFLRTFFLIGQFAYYLCPISYSLLVKSAYGPLIALISDLIKSLLTFCLFRAGFYIVKHHQHFFTASDNSQRTSVI